MPIVGLGVLILWIGWFGFNGGSTFGTADTLFGEVMLNTQLAAAAGVVGALLVVYMKTKTLDVGMAGNGAIAGLVGNHGPVRLRRVLGGSDHRHSRRCARRLRRARGREVPRRSGRRALGARHGRNLGNARGRAIRLAATDLGRRRSRHLVRHHRLGRCLQQHARSARRPGAGGSGSRSRSCSRSPTRRSRSSRRRSGLRVSEEEELAGLDISTHGMYGYPESFIPQEEYPAGKFEPSVAGTPVANPGCGNAAPSHRKEVRK